jgi:UDP:flavonoid glycosyltransferase YjiC (YdhE family)
MSRRRIDLLSPPFAGHLHPLLAIGRALAADHEVRVFSTASALPRIAAAGLAGEVLLPDADEPLRAIVEPPYAVRGNPLRLHRQFRAALALLSRLHAALRERFLAGPPDLVISDFTLAVVGPAATAAGVPWWTTLPSPCVLETPDGPPSYFGGRPPAQSGWQRFGDACGRHATRAFKRTVHWLYRSRIRPLGLPAVYRTDGSEAIYSPHCILALGRAELEFAQCWPTALQFVGPMLYTPPNDHAPPPFRARHTTVLVTLGTHLRFLKDSFAQRVAAMARALPQIDFHFTDGDIAGAVTPQASAGNFQRFAFVDYDRFLHRYQLVVHHGGTGILAHCLRAGLPAVVCPADYDQFDYAARLAYAGLASWCKRPRDLEGTVRGALADEGLRERCRAMQQRMALEDPAQRVRELVARWFAARS